MKKIFITFLTLILVSINLFSSIDFSQVDDLYIQNETAQIKPILVDQLKVATQDIDKAEIYWRLSRIQIKLGDESESKNDKNTEYELALEYANKSIEIYDNSTAHLWKISSVGKLSQTQSMLKAFASVNIIKDELRIILDQFEDLELSEAWFVLGLMYTHVPGGIISFGNKNYGISYLRRAVDTIAANKISPAYYSQAAKAIYNRNWDKNKRTKEFKKSNSNWEKTPNPYDKYAYYEGIESGKNTPYYSTVPINTMSDRQEAVMLLNYAVAKYNVWPQHTDEEDKSIAEVKELISQWT